MTLPRVVVASGSITIVVLALVVAILVWRSVTPTDAKFVASDAHWGTCTQDQQVVHCTAIATVTNQGGPNVTRNEYLAFYMADGTGCDADIPKIDPGASVTLRCVVTMGSNFPPGSIGDQRPSEPPKAIVQP